MLYIMLTFVGPFTSWNVELYVYPGKHNFELGDN